MITFRRGSLRPLRQRQSTAQDQHFSFNDNIANILPMENPSDPQKQFELGKKYFDGEAGELDDVKAVFCSAV